MREQGINLWDAYAAERWVCITTNGVIKQNGEAVMGAGVAEEAALRFPELPKLLGQYLAKYGNRVFWFPEWRLITFPTKKHFKWPSQIGLIKTSAEQLVELCNKRGLEGPIYLPRPGCGKGRLDWNDVRKHLEPILDDRFIVVYR